MPRILLISLLLLLTGISVGAHDLFIKLDTYFLSPNSRANVRLLNGTFQKSDGAVARDRMADASILTPDGQVTHPEATSWRDEGKTTLLDLQTGAPGTYVVSVSTKPREIDLKAADFNEYLAHDGIPDVLAERKRSGELGKNVRERYSKHVRAIFQVGETKTENYKTPLGYPVEIIPQQNPYSLKVGQTLDVLCTLDGKPIANQFVIAGREARGRKAPEINARTDSNGIAHFKLRGAGKWYVKMIHMTALNDPAVNYESKWATLSFEIR